MDGNPSKIWEKVSITLCCHYQNDSALKGTPGEKMQAALKNENVQFHFQASFDCSTNIQTTQLVFALIGTPWATILPCVVDWATA